VLGILLVVSEQPKYRGQNDTSFEIANCLAEKNDTRNQKTPYASQKLRYNQNLKKNTGLDVVWLTILNRATSDS
jgi:hypothetical protein